MSGIVNQWSESALDCLLVHVIGGDWGKDEAFNEEGFESVYCIRGSEFKLWKQNLGSTAVLRKVKLSSLKTRQLKVGDILIEISGGGPEQPVGRTVLISEHVLEQFNAPVVCTNFLRLARPSEKINSSYLNYYLSSFYLSGEVINYQGGSNNLRNLKFKDYSKISIPVAPLAEQKVIADKLDSLLAKVERTKARLDGIPDILKRFRQSVLAAAVSGRLTEEWRGSEEYTDTEFGFCIPSNWSLKSLDDAAQVKGGKRLPKGEELLDIDTGYRYIRAGQLKNGTVISGVDARNKQLYISKETHEKIKRYIISTGNAYLTIVGASIGDAGIVPEYCDGANLTENAAKLCDYKVPLISQFLGYWLRSQYIQDLIQLEIKSGAQGKLALKRIKTLPFPMCSIEEQTEIVQRVEELFAFADAVERKAQAASERVNKLTQSILAKAFRGELTADWRAANPDLISGENSAEALLEKIKAEREALKPKKKTRAKKVKT
ncbi:restriction endonuclease subunit S [Leucothrix pacifica]|uniref:Restriction endonuclease subunit S n=1 Tax=Leucothrix pacifica TaxID=1247513 RepID=A0A317C1J5_9GAMM|nr:restriction endonuclease subunit S [Leucothrix pacifica]PWQ92495.1 restriction endonuclease subunit S [Leucothrix pacifica]